MKQKEKKTNKQPVFQFIAIYLFSIAQCGYAGAASGGQFKRCFGEYFSL